MKQKSKTWMLVVLAAIVVLAVGLVSFQGSSQTKEKSLKVGAILPLTGPTSVLGKGIKRGIESAKKDLADRGINITVVYEDSQASPKKGLTAYKRLTEVENVDAVLTAFSRVSVPLTSQAEKDKVPLLMTLVAAEGVTENKKFSFRLFSKPEDYVTPIWGNFLKEGDKVGILHVNDEFGVSVKEEFGKLAEREDLEIVATEAFSAGSTDLSSQLTKMKQAEIDKLVVVPNSPPEAVGLVKGYRELGMEVPMMDVTGILAVKGIRKQMDKETTEGIYTLAGYPHVHLKKMNEFYLGYDLLNILGEATEGRSIPGTEIAEKIKGIGTYDSRQGKIEIRENGEINPPRVPARIVNGTLEEIGR